MILKTFITCLFVLKLGDSLNTAPRHQKLRFQEKWNDGDKVAKLAEHDEDSVSLVPFTHNDKTGLRAEILAFGEKFVVHARRVTPPVYNLFGRPQCPAIPLSHKYVGHVEDDPSSLVVGHFSEDVFECNISTKQKLYRIKRAEGHLDHNAILSIADDQMVSSQRISRAKDRIIDAKNYQPNISAGYGTFRKRKMCQLLIFVDKPFYKYYESNWSSRRIHPDLPKPFVKRIIKKDIYFALNRSNALLDSFHFGDFGGENAITLGIPPKINFVDWTLSHGHITNGHVVCLVLIFSYNRGKLNPTKATICAWQQLSQKASNVAIVNGAVIDQVNASHFSHLHLEIVRQVFLAFGADYDEYGGLRESVFILNKKFHKVYKIFVKNEPLLASSSTINKIKNFMSTSNLTCLKAEEERCGDGIVDEHQGEQCDCGYLCAWTRPHCCVPSSQSKSSEQLKACTFIPSRGDGRWCTPALDKCCKNDCTGPVGKEERRVCHETKEDECNENIICDGINMECPTWVTDGKLCDKGRRTCINGHCMASLCFGAPGGPFVSQPCNNSFSCHRCCGLKDGSIVLAKSLYRGSNKLKQSKWKPQWLLPKGTICYRGCNEEGFCDADGNCKPK